MSSNALDSPRAPAAPTYIPEDSSFAQAPAPAPSGGRDVPLDLLRGLAKVILVVNHLRLESALGHVTTAGFDGYWSQRRVLVAPNG